MPVAALDSTFGAFPSPTVFLVLYCLKEMKASDDSIRHLLSTMSRVQVHVDLGILGNLFTSLASVLSVLEQGGKQSGIFGLLLLLLSFLKLCGLKSIGSSFLVTVEDLSLHTLDIAITKC